MGTHKDKLDLSVAELNSLSASTDQIINGEVKIHTKVEKSSGSGSRQLNRSELISLFVERLEKKKTVGDRVVPFSRCKECSYEGRHDSIRRHVRKKHAKLLAKRGPKNPTQSIEGAPEIGRPNTDLMIKTKPFIEFLSKQRYNTTGKIFTMSKCKLCPKTARIDRVRRHVIKEHAKELKEQPENIRDSSPEEKMEITTEYPKDKEIIEDEIQIEEIDQKKVLDIPIAEANDYIEVLNKILSRCKVCSKAASQEEIRKHIVNDHLDALDSSKVVAAKISEINTNTAAEDEKTAIERFAEMVEPRVFGNEKFKRICFKCTICETAFRKDRIGSHITINHREHMANHTIQTV